MTVCLRINAMEDEKSSININTINKNSIKKSEITNSVKNKRKDLNKLFKKHKESKRLNYYYNYFDRKFKIINKICKNIEKIDYIYGIPSSNKESDEMPYLENFIIDYYTDKTLK